MWRTARFVRVVGADVIRTIRSFALIVVLTSAVAHAVQEARVTLPPLEPGKALNGALSGGQIARHSITLSAGESATIVLVHRNIDLTVRLFESEAEADIEMASDAATGGSRLRIHATQAGPRTLEIAATYPKSSGGSYTVRIDDVGAGTATERQLYEAHRHHSRASRFRSTGAYAAALSHAEQALGLREKALGPDSLEVARSLLLVGQIKDDQAQFGIAENLYLRARGIAERASDRHDLVYAEILDSLARTSSPVRDSPKLNVWPRTLSRSGNGLSAANISWSRLRWGR